MVNDGMSMHLAHRKGSWVLVSDDELINGRGLQVIEWGHGWSIDKQQQYAARYGMCPRVCDVLDTKRICGKRIKASVANRKTCSRCTLQYPEPSGQTADRSHFKQSHGTQANLELKQVELTICAGPTVEITESMLDVIKTRWDISYAPRTIANMKSGINKFLALYDLDVGCGTDAFTGIFDESWEDVAARIHASKGSHNMFTSVRGMLRHFHREAIAKNLWKYQQSKLPPKEYCQNISPARIQCINTIADKLQVTLHGRASPGAILLDAIRNAVMQYIPKDPMQRKFLFRQLLGWWVPAARNKSSALTVHRGYVQDFEKTISNHVCLNKNGEVKSLFFGNLKMTTTTRYRHCWRKRIQIRSTGIQLHDTKPTIPSYITEDEWSLWWSILATTLDEQITSRRHGAKVFPVAPCADLETEFFGCAVGSMLTRMIFRNGYENVNKFFIEKVMSHCEVVDIKSYVKPVLMYGPWESSIIVTNEDSPAPDHDE